MARKWIQSANVEIDDTTGALLVQLNGQIQADVINADFYALTGGAGGNPGTGGKTLADINSALITNGVKVASLPNISIAAMPNVVISSMPSVVVSSLPSITGTVSLGTTDTANLAAAKADLDALVVNARIPDTELAPAKVYVYAGGYQFLAQVGAGKVGRFVSWFITGQNAGAGVLTLGYSDDNAGNTAWTPVMVINAAANGGGNRENPNALKALCTPTVPTGKYLGIRATGTAFDGLVITGVSAN